MVAALFGQLGLGDEGPGFVREAGGGFGEDVFGGGKIALLPGGLRADLVAGGTLWVLAAKGGGELGGAGKILGREGGLGLGLGGEAGIHGG